jgi:hypothetical protein
MIQVKRNKTSLLTRIVTIGILVITAMMVVGIDTFMGRWVRYERKIALVDHNENYTMYWYDYMQSSYQLAELGVEFDIFPLCDFMITFMERENYRADIYFVSDSEMSYGNEYNYCVEAMRLFDNNTDKYVCLTDDGLFAAWCRQENITVMPKYGSTEAIWPHSQSEMQVYINSVYGVGH